MPISDAVRFIVLSLVFSGLDFASLGFCALVFVSGFALGIDVFSSCASSFEFRSDHLIRVWGKIAFSAGGY